MTESYSRRPARRFHRLIDLAGEEDVSQTRSDRRGEVDDARPVQDPPGAPHPVEELEVLQEGVFGVDRQAVHLATAGGRGEAGLGVAHRGSVEELGESLSTLDLDDERPPALGRERQRECAGDRRLAGAALAGDDVQPYVWPVGVRVPAERRRGRRHGTTLCGAPPRTP